MHLARSVKRKIHLNCFINKEVFFKAYGFKEIAAIVRKLNLTRQL